MVTPERILMFHKPRNVVVTRRDELGRRTVYDALPAWVAGEGFIPVGRLDRDSRGLLLFVQGGPLMDRLSRPGSCAKRYEVICRGHLQPDMVHLLLDGVETPVGRLSAARVEIAGYLGPRTRVHVTLTEGKNRHIRRMFQTLRDPQTGTALKVLELKRVDFGPLTLDVPSGAWRWLSPEEVEALLRS